MPSEIDVIRQLLRDKDVSRLQQLIEPLIHSCDVNADHARVIKHPLGFINYPLAESDAYTLRLHIWPYGIDQLPIIRNHVRDLTSYIVTGSIRNLTYEVHPDTDKPSYRLAEVQYDGLRNVLEASKTTVSCHLISDQVYAAVTLPPQNVSLSKLL